MNMPCDETSRKLIDDARLLWTTKETLFGGECCCDAVLAELCPLFLFLLPLRDLVIDGRFLLLTDLYDTASSVLGPLQRGRGWRCAPARPLSPSATFFFFSLFVGCFTFRFFLFSSVSWSAGGHGANQSPHFPRLRFHFLLPFFLFSSVERRRSDIPSVVADGALQESV